MSEFSEALLNYRGKKSCSLIGGKNMQSAVKAQMGPAQPVEILNQMIYT
jgi:hypothetical protein